jgi:hypothetical protein
MPAHGHEPLTAKKIRKERKEKQKMAPFQVFWRFWFSLRASRPFFAIFAAKSS